MSNPAALLKVQLVLVFLSVTAFAQSVAKKDARSQDFSKEGVVIEQTTTKVDFQSDGTYTYAQRVRVRIQSDAGVRQYGVLPFSYQALVGRVEVQHVRVTAPNGSVVETPLDSIQDVTSEVYRDAPMYSDLREKHVVVKGLEPGDTLEYSVQWLVEKPLAPGQFWIGCQFIKNTVVLAEELDVSVPYEREVKVKSQSIQPTRREENGRRVYTWKTSNLESQSVGKQKEAQSYDAIRGLLPPPDVLVSSFRTWEEVGRWYESLQQEKIQPSPEIKAKAEELTKGLADDEAKMRAIYNYVSLRYRYVGVDFGIGRYQPHAAAEILGNQYGDCKDKHTLLAALLNAIGIRAYPALINSGAAVDQDLPSPGQFNHVISVVRMGSTLSWMDTTPEITAIGELLLPLRGKPALVITQDKVAFQTTPTDSPIVNKDTATVTAKLDADGTLHAHLEAMERGDSELYFRSAFRQWPESQWQELGQKILYGGRLGGTVSNVHTSPPEKTEEPFTLAYDYTLKDFAEGDKHRFVVPLSPNGLPQIKDEDLKRKTPLWIGYVGEWQSESRIELPLGWTAALPKPVNLKESFSEFQGSSDVQQGVLITRRRLLIKANAVTPDQLASYKAFQKAVSDDHQTYILLKRATDLASMPAATPGSGQDLVRKALTELPGSANAEAAQSESDRNAAIVALKHALSLDPGFVRGWLELGGMYAGTSEKGLALDAFQKAVDADPKQAVSYKILALAYMMADRPTDATATLQKLEKITPDDPDLAANLGSILIAQKRYSEALPLFESAAKANPSDAYAQMRLGIVQLRSHNTDLGLDALHKALKIDSGAEILNDIAYEMAETGTNLPDALGYSQQSVRDVEERSQKIDLENIQKTDLQLPVMISAYWDTLGWIYFKMGDLVRAESFLNASWRLGQDGVVGDHLGQLYEKERRLPEALHIYSLALQANPRLEETPSRMRNLAHVHLPEKRMSAGEELGRMRTVKLATITKEPSSADFNVLLGDGGRVEKVNFLRGSPLLRDAAETLKRVQFEEPLPPSSTALLLRRGILSCSSYTGCSFVFYPLSVAASAN